MIKKCLFPAAGYGTRFLPATKAMPKEMLPILTKPLIQYGVEEAMEAGITEMAIVTGRGKRAIEDHFDISYELEHQIQGTDKDPLLADIRHIIDHCSFSYTRQNEVRGLGDAILKGETLIGNQPFAVILSDDLCIGEQQSVLAQMTALYEKHQCSIVAIQEVPDSDVHKYGIISGNEIEPGVYKLTELIEKPASDEAPTTFAIIGRYILTSDIFEILKNTTPGKNNELQITDALNHQAKHEKVLGYNFKGKRFDCGSVDGVVEAINYLFN